MTYEDYIKNPMGKGSSVVAFKALYHKLYTDKWEAVLVKENGKIDYTLYKGKDDFYVHLKIPSELVTKFYYDTVIRFYLGKGNKSDSASTLTNYDVQFYSNDPSFVYSFAYAFKEREMFIEDLESRMSKKALKDKPKVRNPKIELGYVKSIYFAYLQMKKLNLFNKALWSTATEYSSKKWKGLVEHADDKVQKRQELGNELAKKERKEKAIERQKKAEHSAPKKSFGRLSDKFKNVGHIKRTVKSSPNKSIGHISAKKSK